MSRLLVLSCVVLTVVSCTLSSVVKRSAIDDLLTADTPEATEFQTQLVQTLLLDDNELDKLLACLVKEEGCDDIGKHVKSTIGDLLHGRCPNCGNSVQRKLQTALMIYHIIIKRPEIAEQLQKKYAPDYTEDPVKALVA